MKILKIKNQFAYFFTDVIGKICNDIILTYLYLLFQKRGHIIPDFSDFPRLVFKLIPFDMNWFRNICILQNNCAAQYNVQNAVSGHSRGLQGYILCIYNPKRCIFKAFFRVFYVIFLPFSFFPMTLHFHFSPSDHPPPPLPQYFA